MAAFLTDQLKAQGKLHRCKLHHLNCIHGPDVPDQLTCQVCLSVGRASTSGTEKRWFLFLLAAGGTVFVKAPVYRRCPSRTPVSDKSASCRGTIWSCPSCCGGGRPPPTASAAYW
ncbi:hypothetical protein AMECASPLE_016179 [Ameca splendens]|uniref:Uncharacterized protein n=1 Tax=Ameca splendens TaxID=208324 RepID=A0ABV0ZLX7_9TELE